MACHRINLNCGMLNCNQTIKIRIFLWIVRSESCDTLEDAIVICILVVSSTTMVMEFSAFLSLVHSSPIPLVHLTHFPDSIHIYYPLNLKGRFGEQPRSLSMKTKILFIFESEFSSPRIICTSHMN